AGGYGNDIYIYGKGYGNDVITDGCDNNRIKLIGLKPEDISVTFPSGSNDAVITITETEETLTLIKFNYYNGHYRNFTLEFDNGITGHIDDKAANIILDVIETAEAEITVEQTNAEYLSDLYADDVFSEEFTTDSTVIAEVNDSVHIGNSGYEIADMANIQAMILAENMSAFSNESQISSGINVSDITSDSSALDQLLVNSSMQ
ncbi:MAG: hypothetical protein J5724_05430, partial [Ruminococcus sp.]|nr:hypothetical protein [Ruminococcus sp.]